MAEERRHDQVQLVVDGQAMAPDLYPLITLVRVEESVQLPDSFIVRLDDPHFELFDRRLFRIGTSVEISFRSEGELTVVSTGEITAIGVEQAGGGRHELVLQGLDVTHRLAREPRTRTYVQMTDADIAEEVARSHQLATDVEPTGEVREYVLQAAQTDLAFLRERAHRIGFDLWVAGGTLHYKRRPEAAAPAPTLRWGDNLHKFKVRLTSAERCDEVVVRGWDPLTGSAVVGSAQDRDPGTDAQAAGEADEDARSAFGESTRFAGQFPVASQAEAEALAQSLINRASGGEVVVRGETAGDPRIAAGARVTVANVGQGLSGSYLVTSVEHVYGTGSPYVTRFVCGGKDAGGLVDLLQRGPTGAEEGRSWSGLVVGVVTNADDPEKLARVKVKFPSLTDGDESTWARVVAPGAGADRGFHCLPEVGDEVLVGFELGDKLRPLVLGGMWNRSILPPAHPVSSGQVDVRRWVSRTGHEIVLHDGDDDHIEIRHGGGQSSIRIEKDAITVTAGQTLKLEAANIEIAGSSQVTVSGQQIRLN